jgi:hypothetical protein
MSKTNKKRPKKADEKQPTKTQSQEPPKSDDEKPFDFGGLPNRDLKKNLGCG